MCGIVYAHDFSGAPVNNGILQQFDAQRHRGLQGFGLFDGQEKHIVHSSTEDKILKWLVKYDSNLILFHHRYPTSSPNTKRNAHPFSTGKAFGDSQYILVHNGHISNAKELKAEHEKAGFEYQTENLDGSFNDSEALLWDMALYLEGHQKQLEFWGLAAFVAVKLVKGKLDKMYFGTNGNPLKMFRDSGGIALSSEGPGEPIKEQTLYTWNYELKRLTSKSLKIPRWNPAYDFGNGDDRGYSSRTSSYEYSPGQFADDRNTLRLPAGPDDDESYSDSHYDDDLRYQHWHIGNTIRERWSELKAQGNISDDEIDELMETLPEPDEGKVEVLALNYLASHEGNFEGAYGELEMDYMQIAEDVPNGITSAELEEMRIFEEAMTYLATDPEYLSENSISSMWENGQLALV